MSDAHDQKARRASGQLESEVLGVLWADEAPLTPHEVQQGLGGVMAYNTVQTILTRLLDKGLVIRDTSTRAHTYRPAVGQSELAAQQMHVVLDRSDHASVLQRFVEGLSEADSAAVRALLTPAAKPSPRSRRRQASSLDES